MKLNSKNLAFAVLLIFGLNAWGDSDELDLQETQTPPGEVSEGMYKKFNDARKAKNLKQAQEAAGDILSRNPTDIKTLNALAVLAIEQGKYDLAKMFLSKVFKADPSNASAHNNTGVIYLKSDNLRLALVEFKKTLEKDPENKFARANLGSVYLQYRNYPAAVEELEAAVGNGDKSPETLNDYAFALSATGKADKAVSIYEDALEKSPNNSTILFNYAVCLIDRAGQGKKGLKVLNKLKFTVNDPAILEKIAQLTKKAESKGD